MSSVCWYSDLGHKHNRIYRTHWFRSCLKMIFWFLNDSSHVALTSPPWAAKPPAPASRARAACPPVGVAILSKNNWPSLVKFENREIWADLENRSKVVHSENFPIWRPASGDWDHVTHHVTSHVTHWGQWKYASRSWHAVGNHRRQLKLMYRSKISGRGP